MSDFQIVLCTCDSYMDLCDNFFILLKKYWPDFNGEVFFNGEKNKYNNPNYKIINVEHNYSNSWSQRLYDSLCKVESEFVMLFLEDYYLEGSVDNAEFLRCLSYMKKNKKVNSIIFTQEPGVKRDKIIELGDFAYRKYFSLYKITAHIGLYRVDFLKKMLKINESAWQFEVNGSIRSFFMPGKYICKTTKQFTFPYSYGLLVTRGKYNKELKEYFEKNEKLVFVKQRDSYSNTGDIQQTVKGSFMKKIKYGLKGFFSLFSKGAEK